MCVCVCVGVAAECEATEGWKTTSIWWNSPREPHFPFPSTPNTITKYLTHHPRHTHKHTSVVLERRLKYYDRCSSPDRLHSSNAAVYISSCSLWRWIKSSQIDIVFCLVLCRVPLVPMEILARLVHPDLRYPIANYLNILCTENIAAVIVAPFCELPRKMCIKCISVRL